MMTGRTTNRLSKYGVIVALCTFSAVASANCSRGAVSCTVMTGIKTCNADVDCVGIPMGNVVELSVTSSTGILGCQPTMTTAPPMGFAGAVNFTISASASTMAQSTHSCTWRWSIGGVRRGGGLFVISDAQGLPVELMDFAVDEESEGPLQ